MGTLTHQVDNIVSVSLATKCMERMIYSMMIMNYELINIGLF